MAGARNSVFKNRCSASARRCNASSIFLDLANVAGLSEAGLREAGYKHTRIETKNRSLLQVPRAILHPKMLKEITFSRVCMLLRSGSRPRQHTVYYAGFRMGSG